METLGAVILSALPPAGNRVLYKPCDEIRPPDFDGYGSLCLDSGTSALSLAIVLAKSLRPELKEPEVIVPAYCCPDLVAAAVFAGVRPLVVDIGPGDPGYFLPFLKAAIGTNTIAVIAVNFLGICDRLQEIRRLLPKGSLLIEDNAQWYPEVCQSSPLHGDLVITSFGRGKPASVLGGGLLLLKSGVMALEEVESDPGKLEEIFSALVQVDNDESSKLKNVEEWIKVRSYNVLRQPFFYFWLSKLSFLKLGETRYHPVVEVKSMTRLKRRQLRANLEYYLDRDCGLALESLYDEMNLEGSGMLSIAKQFSDRRKRLLRYPILCESRAQRDRVLAEMVSKGLGATGMYCRRLTEIDGVGDKVTVFGSTDNADDFSGRFITLPIHDLVDDTSISSIANILNEASTTTRRTKK